MPTRLQQIREEWQKQNREVCTDTDWTTVVTQDELADLQRRTLAAAIEAVKAAATSPDDGFFSPAVWTDAVLRRLEALLEATR